MEQQGMGLFGAYSAVTILAGDIVGMGMSSSSVRAGPTLYDQRTYRHAGHTIYPGPGP